MGRTIIINAEDLSMNQSELLGDGSLQSIAIGEGVERAMAHPAYLDPHHILHHRAKAEVIHGLALLVGDAPIPDGGIRIDAADLGSTPAAPKAAAAAVGQVVSTGADAWTARIPASADGSFAVDAG